MNQNDTFRRIRRGVLDLFFPRNCIYTGERLGVDSGYRYLSRDAAQEIHWVRGNHCLTCGYPFDGELVGERQCPNCVELGPIFEEGRTAFLLKDAGRKLVHELKYHQGFHLWKDVTAIVSQVTDYVEFASESVLIPVPLHGSKLRKRGFNQSLLLAKAVGKVARNSEVQDILRRVKRTRTQTRLSKEERKKNVKNAFSLSKKSDINSNSNYILVDDVYTTGATLNACARVLKEHGAKHIKVITLGHG